MWHNQTSTSVGMDNINAQIEHLQSKYVGTGHPDTNRYEWISNHHRDSLASYVGHPSLLEYFAIAENTSIAKYRYQCLDKMYRPCGPAPPPKIDED